MNIQKFLLFWWRLFVPHFSELLEKGNSYRVIQLVLSDGDEYERKTILIKVSFRYFNHWCYFHAAEFVGSVFALKVGDQIHWNYGPRRHGPSAFFEVDRPSWPLLYVWHQN